MCAIKTGANTSERAPNVRYHMQAKPALCGTAMRGGESLKADIYAARASVGHPITCVQFRCMATLQRSQPRYPAGIAVRLCLAPGQFGNIACTQDGETATLAGAAAGNVYAPAPFA